MSNVTNTDSNASVAFLTFGGFAAAALLCCWMCQNTCQFCYTANSNSKCYRMVSIFFSFFFTVMGLMFVIMAG